MRSSPLLQWVQCIDSRAGRPGKQLIFPEIRLAVVTEAMLNSGSWLKLVAVVTKVLSPLGNTRCCDGPGQGTQLWWRGLEQRGLLDLAQVWVDLQWMGVGAPQRGAGQTNSPMPSPAASYFIVGIATPNSEHPKVRCFRCSCQQVNILINSESTESKWSLCDRFSGIFSNKDMTFFIMFTS